LAKPFAALSRMGLMRLCEEILRRLATGETLTEICADPAIPVSTGAVRQWDVDDRDGWFSGAYARARRQ
jgi:hypothetical protein